VLKDRKCSRTGSAQGQEVLKGKDFSRAGSARISPGFQGLGITNKQPGEISIR
jgi:hypothetical protein